MHSRVTDYKTHQVQDARKYNLMLRGELTTKLNMYKNYSTNNEIKKISANVQDSALVLGLLLTPLTSSPPWQSGVSLFPKAAFLGWKNFFIHATYRQGSHHTRQGVDHLLLFVFNNPVLPCPFYGVSALKWAQLSFFGPLSISPSTPLKPHYLWPAGSRYNGLKITVTVRICVWWFNAWELGKAGRRRKWRAISAS